MCDKKTPEERAEEHASRNLNRESWRWLDARSDYLAGRADFIKHELPKLLEMARKAYDIGGPCEGWAYEIPELIAMAKCFNVKEKSK